MAFHTSRKSLEIQAYSITCLRHRRSKPSVYKWFWRVRGPAATQAIYHKTKNPFEAKICNI